ncbi:hypothetical protein H6P81_012961 [Aristolochia fimbriata]|uniref:UDP-N-acetylglucosamine 1-carboxyvinyltransferase n=1 Tax=Aristolochia fimbriata TaxID=158543 RepID=A0AAV7EDL6_ARIFI|nr:hypothetical protein H6P81_012961 [Aristolochia fimbriata]
MVCDLCYVFNEAPEAPQALNTYNSIVFSLSCSVSKMSLLWVGQIQLLRPALPRRQHRRRRIPPHHFAPASAYHWPTSENAVHTKTLEERFVISGGRELSGHVHISGSKNSALAILAGTLCCYGTSVIHRVPKISDVATMLSVLRSLGATVEVSDRGVRINTDGVCSVEPCSESMLKIRAGFFVIGPLLARFGEAVVSLPGGCNIGSRPVDLKGRVHARAENGRCLVGGKFHLDYPSVGATETLMIAASMAEGVTVLSNAAQEPEVADLAEFLNASGAKIEGGGTPAVVIHGRKWLHGPEFTVIPDRIEAGTYMMAAAITHSCISMSPIFPSHLLSLITKLSAAGCEIIQKEPHYLEVSAVSHVRGVDLRGVHIRTAPFPGFPTDLQPQFMTLLSTCSGPAFVEETVFEGRMSHVKELQKLGAHIQVCENSALVCGRGHLSLHGSRVHASDLRGGASLILAGLAAEGVTVIAGASHIDRGYENLEQKLQLVGANIRREPDS